MKKLLLVFLVPALLFGQKASVQYDTRTHGVIAPPSAPGATYDYDFTGLNIGGLATGGPGPGGTPGGINQQLQYNNASTFGGIPYLLFTGTAVTQQVGSRYFLIDPTDNTKRVQISLQNPTGTLKTLTISDDSVTVIPSSVTPNQFMTNVNTLGVAVTAQPLFSNLGGTLSLSQTSMSTNKLLGRGTAGTGAIEEITLGTGLSFTGTTLNAAAGSSLPGGLSNQFQYNNAGAFAGTGFLTFVGGEIDANTTAWRFFDNADATKKLSINLTNLPTATSASLMIPLSPVAVTSSAGVANQWVQYIDFLGQQHLAQPAFSNLSGSLSLAQQNIPIGKERFVDPTNGSDITGAANLARPYLTVAGACAASSSGDTIYLYPNTTGYDQGTTPLVIPAGVTIVGAGSAVTLIKGAFATSSRGVVEPSTGSAIYNVSIQNTSTAGFGFGVGPSSAAFTSAFIGGSRIIANNGVGIHIGKAGTTGLVGENVTVTTQNDCFYQDQSTATTEFRNCAFISDGTATAASRGLDVIGGTVRYNYGDITVGGSTNTNIGARADGSGTVVELHGVRISNSGGGTTNNDVRQTSSASLGVDNVTRPDAGALVTSGTITQLSRYASRDAGLLDYPNLGPATRGDIIYFNGTSWVKLGAGLDGNVLTTHGTTADPNWLTGGGGGGAVSDTVFGPAWLGQTTTGPSQNSAYNYLHLIAPNDDGKVNLLNQTAGIANTDGSGVIQGPLAIPAGALVGTTATQTLTNKRITKRVLSVTAPGGTPAINTDNYDVVNYTGLNAPITSFTITGTPVPGDSLRIVFTDDGTARAITFPATDFEPSPGQALPTTTTAATRMDVGFFWNGITSKWRCVASSNASAVSGAGTVTSVGITGNNGITSSGGPITSSGSISLGLPITLAGTAGKTLTVSNSMTLAAANDVSTLNIGTGGTLGSNAFTSTAFLTASSISDAAWAATWNADTTGAASRHATYVWGHTFDTDDNGLPNKLDMANGIAKVTSNIVGPATAGTDYADLAFKTVSVSGQSDVVADSAGDTLTLAAGSNVTITTTPGTDTVTIAASGGAAGSVPTGTGFYRVTSGVMNAAAVGETGSGNVVRSSGATLTDASLKQSANFAGVSAAYGYRFTDTSPVGSLLLFKNAAQSTTLWDVDVTGTLNTGIVPWARITGTPTTLAGYGITDATSLAFKTISVSGQSDVVADTATDTLTLVAGSNVTLTTTAGTDTVTIAATGGGGTPGGSNTQVQFNDSSAFGGDAGLTYNKTTDTLTLAGQVLAPYGSAGTPSFSFSSDATTGFYGHTSTGIIGASLGGVTKWFLAGGVLRLGNDIVSGWSSTNDAFSTALDTALYRNAAGIVEINNGTAGSYRDLICRNITISGGNFSGRINPRATGSCEETSSGTSTPLSDSCDQWDVTALAASDTFVAPSGTPVNGQKLIIRIKDNGTAQTLSFPTASSGQYKFSTDLPAPTTTILGKTFYLGFIYNSASSRWENVSQMNNF